MKTHYYLGWFNNSFPDYLGRVLQEEITDRRSLAMISSNPCNDEDDGASERSWLDQAGIVFDESHLINYRVRKQDAQLLIQQASVIFVLGGDTVKQNEFLAEYELTDPIKKAMPSSLEQVLVQLTCLPNGYAQETWAITLKRALYTMELVLIIFLSCLTLILKII